MLIVFPLLAFYLFFRLFAKKGSERRVAFLTAAVLWGASLLAITELLSIPRWIYPIPLAAAWAAVCIAVFLYERVGLKNVAKAAAEPIPGPQAAPATRLEKSSKWLLAGVGVLVLGVGITAVAAPPATWDAMEYHLPRGTMWMSNHSVRFFPTPDYRQLVLSPWAEYAMMQTQELWGSDRLVNLVEFLSLLGCLLAASYIAKLLGAGPRGQVLAAVACAAIPQTLLEASGPMDTCVASFWVAATVAFLLLWNRKPSLFFAVCTGCAAGLAVATKGTAYVILPFLVLACWWMGSRETRIRFVKLALLFLVPIILLNLPQYARNYDFAHSITGVPTPDRFGMLEVRTEKVTIKRTAANVVRNISLHAGLVGHVNNRISAGFRWFIAKELGANPDDPKAVFDRNFEVNHYSLNEVTAGDPILLLVLLLVLGIVLCSWKRFSVHGLPWYGLALIFAFLLFSALLHWQRWGARFQLPLFIAAAPLIGAVLESWLNGKTAAWIAAFLILAALPDAVANRFRSLVPMRPLQSVYQARRVLYFAEEHMTLAPLYISLADAVNQTGCKNVAIDAYTPTAMRLIKNTPQSWYQYPLFALIHADGVHRTVWYTDVHNLSSKYVDANPHPAACAVVCLQCAAVPEKMQEYESAGGRATVIGSDVLFQFVPAELHAGSAPLPAR